MSKFVEVALHRMKVNKTVNRLKAQRKLSGLTQTELANRSGVSLRMIRAYEQGQQPLAKAEAGTVFSLAKALGCDAEALLG